MRQRLRSHLTYANVMATLAVFLVLGGGTALASYVISSNSQVGPGTISGHKPPSGDHANVIAGSVNGQDLAGGSVTSSKLGSSAVTNPKLANGAVTVAKLNIPGHFISAGLPNAAGDCGSINGWANWSPDVNNTVGYYRGPNGIVHLQGTAQPCGAHGFPIFDLPAGYRPAHRTYVLAVDHSAISSEIVTLWEKDQAPDHAGSVDPANPGHEVSLDGISFRCGPSGVSGCP